MYIFLVFLFIQSHILKHTPTNRSTLWTVYFSSSFLKLNRHVCFKLHLIKPFIGGVEIFSNVKHLLAGSMYIYTIISSRSWTLSTYIDHSLFLSTRVLISKPSHSRCRYQVLHSMWNFLPKVGALLKIVVALSAGSRGPVISVSKTRHWKSGRKIPVLTDKKLSFALALYIL